MTCGGLRLSRLVAGLAAAPWRCALCLPAVLAASGCSLRVLDPAGPVAAGERTILLNSLAVMLCIVVPTMLATIAFAWWFREGNPQARRLPHWSFSGRIEIVTWSVPVLAILFLGGTAWVGSHELDPATPLPATAKPLEVQVVSLDWKWLFIYPEQHIASLNQLVLPKDVPVHLSLTSDGVWDSFFVPQLGSMIYTMNGMATHLNLRADREGSFRGLSTHLSGDGFSDMHFETLVVGGDAFGRWVAAGQTSAEVLDDGAYQALTVQSERNHPAIYHVADDDLFGKVVSQTLPPGPGPSHGRPNVTVNPKTGG